MSETQNKEVYILLDSKLNAIIGTFTTLDKVLNAKKEAYKNDLSVIKKHINQRMTLYDIDIVDRMMLSGILNQIDYVKGDYNNRYDKVVIEYEGYNHTNRFRWYMMPLDTFNSDKIIYGPIIFLPIHSS